MIKIWRIWIFKMAAKMAELYFKQHILQPTVHSFLLQRFHFYMYIYIYTYIYICIYVCSPLFLLFIVWVSNFHVTLLEVSQKIINIWLLCIFKMAAKMTTLWSEQHIILSTAPRFNCKSLDFPYVSQKNKQKIIKFGSFAYSRWPPK